MNDISQASSSKEKDLALLCDHSYDVHVTPPILLYTAGWTGRRDRIPAPLAFKILECEAQKLLYHTLAYRYDYSKSEATEKIQEAVAEQKAAMAKLFELGVPEPSPFDPEEPISD